MQKPLMLTHEVDRAKGGGPMDAIKAELGDKKLRQAVFSETRITTWYRIAEFQIVSLKEIAEFVLLQTPEYKALDELPTYVPGEVMQQPLSFQAPVVVYTSPFNPSARQFAEELEQAYSGKHQGSSARHASIFRQASRLHFHGQPNLSLTEDLPTRIRSLIVPFEATKQTHQIVDREMALDSADGIDTIDVISQPSESAQQHEQRNDLQSIRPGQPRPVHSGGHDRPTSMMLPAVEPTHFLLYLNSQTFIGPEGVQLAEELRQARATSLPVVMVHEQEDTKGGCEFARMFTTTPHDLIDDGLYNALAFSAYPGEKHRAVSLALVAKALGSVRKSVRKSLVLKSADFAECSATRASVSLSGAGSQASPVATRPKCAVQAAKLTVGRLKLRKTANNASGKKSGCKSSLRLLMRRTHNVVTAVPS